MKQTAAITVILSFFFITTSAMAADHANLEEGIPTSLEDAYPAAYLNRELQTAFEYRRDSDNRNIYYLEPRFEVGFLPNWQGTIKVPVAMGAEHEGSGDIALAALYNPFQETIYIPAFALSAEGVAPSGKDSAGVDSTYKLIATKTIPGTSLLQRLHANVIYHHNAASPEEDRRDLIKAVGGYEVRLDADTIGIADYLWEQDQKKGQDNNLLELGIRRQLTPLMLIAVGGAVGLDDDSDGFRLTAGFQRSF